MMVEMTDLFHQSFMNVVVFLHFCRCSKALGPEASSLRLEWSWLREQCLSLSSYRHRQWKMWRYYLGSAHRAVALHLGLGLPEIRQQRPTSVLLKDKPTTLEVERTMLAVERPSTAFTGCPVGPSGESQCSQKLILIVLWRVASAIPCMPPAALHA